MMTTFARLFETESGQLLVTREYDDTEDEPYTITVRGASVRGADPTLTLFYVSESERDGLFDGLDQEQAESLARDMAQAAGNFIN